MIAEEERHVSARLNRKIAVPVCGRPRPSRIVLVSSEALVGRAGENLNEWERGNGNGEQAGAGDRGYAGAFVEF